MGRTAEVPVRGAIKVHDRDPGPVEPSWMSRVRPDGKAAVKLDQVAFLIFAASVPYQNKLFITGIRVGAGLAPLLHYLSDGALTGVRYGIAQ